MSNSASQPSADLNRQPVDPQLKDNINKFLFSVTSCKRLSDRAQFDIVSRICANPSEITIATLAKRYGLAAFSASLSVNQEEKILAYKESALQIFDYLPTDTPLCLHTGCYPSLVIGPEQPASLSANQHLPIPFASGKIIATRLLKHLTFGLLINGFAIREIAHYTNGSIAAICYGCDNVFVLRSSPDKKGLNQ